MRVFQHASIVFVALGLIYSSCTKDKGVKSPTVSARVNSAQCFPYDSCVVRFSLETKGTTSPIQVTWIEPSVLSGTSDLSILLDPDQKLKARVQDAKSNLIFLDTVFRKANFDSLVFDYRLPVLGKYKGLLRYKSAEFDGVNWFFVYSAFVPSEIEISVNTNFTCLNISGFGPNSPMTYNFHKSLFFGHRTTGFFENDSVYITYQPALGPSWNIFKGKRSD